MDTIYLSKTPFQAKEEATLQAENYIHQHQILHHLSINKSHEIRISLNMTQRWGALEINIQLSALVHETLRAWGIPRGNELQGFSYEGPSQAAKRKHCPLSSSSVLPCFTPYQYTPNNSSHDDGHAWCCNSYIIFKIKAQQFPRELHINISKTFWPLCLSTINCWDWLQVTYAQPFSFSLSPFIRPFCHHPYQEMPIVINSVGLKACSRFFWQSRDNKTRCSTILCSDKKVWRRVNVL